MNITKRKYTPKRIVKKEHKGRMRLKNRLLLSYSIIGGFFGIIGFFIKIDTTFFLIIKLIFYIVASLCLAGIVGNLVGRTKIKVGFKKKK